MVSHLLALCLSSASYQYIYGILRPEDGVRFQFSEYSLENILQSIGRYCLDEGIGIFDRNRTSNIETANMDVSSSRDERLLSAVEAVRLKPESTRIKK